MKRPGLLAEVCGLRVSDVDFKRGTVSPVQQYPADPPKTDMSRTPVPIPQDLALLLAAHVGQFSTKWVMCETTLDTYGHPVAGLRRNDSGRHRQCDRRPSQSCGPFAD